MEAWAIAIAGEDQEREFVSAGTKSNRSRTALAHAATTSNTFISAAAASTKSLSNSFGCLERRIGIDPFKSNTVHAASKDKNKKAVAKSTDTPRGITHCDVLLGVDGMNKAIQGMNKGIQAKPKDPHPTTYEHMDAERLVGTRCLENDPVTSNTLCAAAISTEFRTASKREVNEVTFVQAATNSNISICAAGYLAVPATAATIKSRAALIRAMQFDSKMAAQSVSSTAATSTKSRTGSKMLIPSWKSKPIYHPKSKPKDHHPTTYDYMEAERLGGTRCLENDPVSRKKTSTSSTAVKPPVVNADFNFKHSRGKTPGFEVIDVDAEEPVKSNTAGVELEPPEAVKSSAVAVKLESKPFKTSEPEFLIKARELYEEAKARADAEAAESSVVPEPVTSAFPEPVSSGGVSSSATKEGVVDLTLSDDDE